MKTSKRFIPQFAGFARLTGIRALGKMAAFARVAAPQRYPFLHVDTLVVRRRRSRLPRKQLFRTHVFRLHLCPLRPGAARTQTAKTVDTESVRAQIFPGPPGMGAFQQVSVACHRESPGSVELSESYATGHRGTRFASFCTSQENSAKNGATTKGVGPPPRPRPLRLLTGNSALRTGVPPH